MATIYADPHVSSSDRLAAERRLQRAVRIINGRAWRQRLAPLARYMGDCQLIRARSDRGAALALLDLDTLQQALVRLQQHDPIQFYLVVALAVENANAVAVAAELGMDQGHIMGALHAAMAALALDYEAVAFAGAVEAHDLGAAVCAAMRNERRRRQ